MLFKQTLYFIGVGLLCNGSLSTAHGHNMVEQQVWLPQSFDETIYDGHCIMESHLLPRISEDRGSLQHRRLFTYDR
jgi:hypothetical protein